MDIEIMKPTKDKAQELYEYFECSKKYTNLCVDNIIELAELENNTEAIAYFKEVKKEIKKL